MARILQDNKAEFIDLEDNKVVSSKVKLITHYLLILDKSGSMAVAQKNTIKGFNDNIKTIKELAKKNPNQEFYISLVMFNNEVETLLWERPLQDIQCIDDTDYRPCGLTALHDALGSSLDKLEKELEKELKENNESKVVVTIFTDGAENASKDYTSMQVADKSEVLQETEQWLFSYIGANHDVAFVAKSLNIPLSNTLKYTSSMIGTAEAFDSQTKGLHKYVSDRSLGITDNHLYTDKEELLDISDDKDE